MANSSSPAPGGIDIEPPLRDELEALLASAVSSSVPWLADALARLLRRPGKRLRPALVLAAAACGPRPDRSAALACAAAVELLHQSSLVHDDLMDQAHFRGDDATLYSSLGPGGAVIGGDYLLASAGRLISGVGRAAAELWHDAYLRMCEGQAREAANLYRLTTTEEYLAAIRGKTAALTGAACRLGGLCALDATGQRALGAYGESFGIMFQILDDLMDVLSTPALWGKPVQHDLGNGVYTLPLLLAVREHPALGELLGPAAQPTTTDHAYEVIRAVAVPPTVAAIYRWAEHARAELAVLPPSDARDTLADLPERYAAAVLTDRVDERYRGLVAPLVRAHAEAPRDRDAVPR